MRPGIRLLSRLKSLSYSVATSDGSEETNMRSINTAALMILLSVSQAHAALNAFYKGTESFNGKDVPATATMSYSDGRAAMVVKGSKSFRLLYLKKEGLLRMVDDTGKQYIDIAPGPGGNPMAALMSQQMANLPPEQRQMAQQMLQSMRGAVQPPPPKEYVLTKESATVKGYPCTWVNILEGGVKRAAYCGTASPDFKLNNAELESALGMYQALGQFTSSLLGSSGLGQGASRGFQWDTTKEMYPLISRCFDGEKIILNLELDSFNRSEPSEDLFSIPKNYKKQ
jgi:hypothetical protein